MPIHWYGIGICRFSPAEILQDSFDKLLLLRRSFPYDKLFKSLQSVIQTKKSGERLSQLFDLTVDAIFGGFETNSGCDRRKFPDIGPYTVLFDPKNIDLSSEIDPVIDISL
ncbi:hypothetical protein DSCOOX_62320 [Desulfosarcina ovata subsp. ovata]|uniref:Uncharacterized protein n=1 Tax=Desulfosarcina ovata subsp. ovata TaxID=2752305 RepID=A0A5K8AK27_9BACT|nr:hypothetical protein DSCOOX_62320 [Desulfosarcina ovata subsp. ovata]